jgi:hypothetical protein
MSNNAETWKYAQKALSWYGWGSPVGGLLIVAIAASRCCMSQGLSDDRASK